MASRLRKIGPEGPAPAGGESPSCLPYRERRTPMKHVTHHQFHVVELHIFVSARSQVLFKTNFATILLVSNVE